MVTKLVLELDVGEAEAVALAKELEADVIMIDERSGSRRAREERLETIGLLGIVVKAKEDGHIAAKPILERIKLSGFWMSDKLVRTILRTINES